MKTVICDNGQAMLVRQGDSVRKVKLDKIIYVESDKRRNILHYGDEKIAYYGSIGALSEELPDAFFRIHKGYIIHMKYIEKYDRTQVFLKNGESLLISKYRYNDFIAAYMRFLQR